MSLIRWAIGFDPGEAGPYATFAHSLQKHSSMPIAIIPVDLRNLRGILTRPRDPLQSNEFSFSRFLIPWMMGFEGWCVFSDCDQLALDDPAKLWARRDDRFAVMCVRQNHTPTEETKFLGNPQTKYFRKNWSSVMLWNCAHLSNRTLTPEFVNEAHGLNLHQFTWLNGEDIGYLPTGWNHLVGFRPYDHNAQLVHFTTGGPWLDEYKNVDYHQEWHRENAEMNYVRKK